MDKSVSADNKDHHSIAFIFIFIYKYIFPKSSRRGKLKEYHLAQAKLIGRRNSKPGLISNSSLVMPVDNLENT